MMHLVHPFVDPAREADLLRIADVALANGVPVLRQLHSTGSQLDDPLGRIAFVRAVYDGFSRAQHLLLDYLSSLAAADISWQTEAAFRGLANAIAWQMLSGQTYIARQVFRKQTPVRLRERDNLQSVINAAKYAQGTDLCRFVLISDLTTFVQVGDLLIGEPLDGRITLVEVKEGEVNRAVGEFLESMPRAEEKEIDDFLTRYGRKGFEQLGRLIRVLLVDSGSSPTAVGGGTIMKIFFHGLTPRSSLQLLRRIAGPK
jgi:hypothetical protein